MNDFDLDQKLKALRAPERDPAYWELFPRRVLVRASALPKPGESPVWFPRLAWGAGVAFAVLVVAFSSCPGLACPMKTVAYAVQRARAFEAELAELPQRARALVRIDHGLHGLLTEEQ